MCLYLIRKWTCIGGINQCIPTFHNKHQLLQAHYVPIFMSTNLLQVEYYCLVSIPSSTMSIYLKLSMCRFLMIISIFQWNARIWYYLSPTYIVHKFIRLFISQYYKFTKKIELLDKMLGESTVEGQIFLYIRLESVPITKLQTFN